MRKLLLGSLVLCLVVATVGCHAGHMVKAPTDVTVTSQGATDKDKALGFVTGNSCGISLFMILPIGGDFNEAMMDAVQMAKDLGANTIVDAECDGWGGQGINLTLGSRHYYVRGMAVKR